MLHKRIDKHINDDGSRSNDYIISSIPLINNSNKSFINTKPFYSTSIPLACIGALVLLGLASINPSSIIANNLIGSSNGSVYAEEVTSTGTAISLSIDGLTGGEDGGSINSTVNATNYDTAYISHNVTVSGSNIDSYSLQLTAADGYTSSLVNNGGEGGATLASIAGAGGAIGSNMEDNTWGYSWGEVDTDVSTLPYYTLPEYGSESEGVLESAANVANGTVEFTKKLSFGAKFNGVPAGHYTTTALLSLAAGTKEVVKTWETMTYMQEMTPEICSSAPLNEQKTLTDSRDGSTYTIARIKNQTNNLASCWMTQNLRIVNKTLKLKDSDVSDDFIIPTSSGSGFTSSDQYESKVYYDDRNSTYGAYYNWYTATAGTGDENLIVGGTYATSSVCPKGWRLPTGESTGEYAQLLGGSLQGSQILSSPYNFTKGGFIQNSNDHSIGAAGRYWSGTAISNSLAHSLGFASAISSSTDDYRYTGLTIRCIAK